MGWGGADVKEWGGGVGVVGGAGHAEEEGRKGFSTGHGEGKEGVRAPVW